MKGWNEYREYNYATTVIDPNHWIAAESRSPWTMTAASHSVPSLVEPPPPTNLENKAL